MVISAIICEYNPFHNGHKYQIAQTYKNGATHIVAIMSGNFTQRGTPSIISKHAKTEIALKNGCDLVLEIPTPYVISNAEKFAFGAIFILNAMGCINFLSFGCENNNINDLQKIADISDSDKVIFLTKKYLKKGISFVAARCNAIKEIYDENFARIISLPNNILAIEYIKNLKKLNSNIKTLALLRKSCNHNGNFTADNYANSSLLRKMIFENDNNFKKFVPKNIYESLKKEIKNASAPASLLNCERAILSKLRCMEAKDFLQIADVSEGLENKIYKAIQNSTSLTEVYNKIKTKRYTNARIQRIITSSFLEINKDFFNFFPPYIKILGFNQKGKEILTTLKQTSKLPIVTKFSDMKKLKNNPNAIKLFNLESRVYDLYNLMLPKVQKCAFESKTKIIKI